ncbi:MAG: patatin-like phospholipase family protein [Stappiaceae bacterium]
MIDPKIAIALGAGGARGIAHIHALQALDDLGITPVAITGTSIGAIMGAAFASGMTGEDIHEYVDQLFNNRRQLLARLFKIRPESVRQFMDDGGIRFGEINIERVLEVFLPPDIPENYSELNIPLRVVATDYYQNRDRFFSEGLLRPTLAASAAMPAIFLPVIIDGHVFIDGGTTNPAPFDDLSTLADIVVAIDVSGGPKGDPGTRPGKIDVVYAASQLMQQSIVRAKAETHRVDILLRPDVADFRVLDFLRTSHVLDQSKALRDDLKRALSLAIDNFSVRNG